MATIPLSFNVYASGNNIEVVESNNDLYIGAINLESGGVFNTGILNNFVNKSETGDFVLNLQLIPLATKSYVDTASGVLDTKINNIPSVNTGSLINVFYPLDSNPAGFITSANGALNISGVGNILNGQLLVGSTSENAFVQGNINSTGGITLTKTSGNILVGTDNTIVKSSQTGILATISQLSSYVQNSQTGNLATKSYVDNAVAGVSGQGGGSGTIVKVTGSANQPNINVSGIGSVKVVLSGGNLIISGNPSGAIPPGNFAQVTSGTVTMVGGGTITNGELLIGDASDNSFKQGRISAGNGINITSGAGNLTISATVTPPNLPPPYFFDIKLKGTNYTIGTGDFTIVHTGNPSITLTLPSATGLSGRMWVIKNASATGATTVSSSSQIYSTGLSTSLTFKSGDAFSFQSNGSLYYAH